MSITTSDWVAQIDRMPGSQAFRVYGTVQVAHTGITPTLVMSELQDRSFDLRLILKLENSGGNALPVVTEKTVSFIQPGNSNVSGVSIFFEGELLHRIRTIMITD